MSTHELMTDSRHWLWQTRMVIGMWLHSFKSGEARFEILQRSFGLVDNSCFDHKTRVAGATLVPSPPSSGERVRVRGSSRTERPCH